MHERVKKPGQRLSRRMAPREQPSSPVPGTPFFPSGHLVPALGEVNTRIPRVHPASINPAGGVKRRIGDDGDTRPGTPGEIRVIDNTCDHEVWDGTGEQRLTSLFHFGRTLRRSGCGMNRGTLWPARFPASDREPLRNSPDAEKRFSEATRRADAAVDRTSDRP